MINDDDYDDDNDDDNDHDKRLQLGPGRPALQQQILQAHVGHTGQADLPAMFDNDLQSSKAPTTALRFASFRSVS